MSSKKYNPRRYNTGCQVVTESLTYSDFKRQMKEQKLTLDYMHGMGIRQARLLIHSIMNIVEKVELSDASTISSTYGITMKDLDTYSGPYFNSMIDNGAT